MKVRNLALGAAALAMTTAPALAQGANASRGSAPSDEASSLRGRAGGGLFIGIIAIIAVTVGIILIENEDNDPVSP